MSQRMVGTILNYFYFHSNERIPNNAIAVLSEEEEEAISEPETNLDDVKTFQCDECPGQFRYQRSYLKHMEQCHQKNETSTAVHNRRTSKKAIFKCDYCDKKYTSDKLLKKHSNHHGELRSSLKSQPEFRPVNLAVRIDI